MGHNKNKLQLLSHFENGLHYFARLNLISAWEIKCGLRKSGFIKCTIWKRCGLIEIFKTAFYTPNGVRMVLLQICNLYNIIPPVLPVLIVQKEVTIWWLREHKVDVHDMTSLISSWKKNILILTPQISKIRWRSSKANDFPDQLCNK